MDEIFTVGNGTGTALGKNGHSMKRNRQILKARTRLSLGDLILAVSSCTNSSRDAGASETPLDQITILKSRSAFVVGSDFFGPCAPHFRARPEEKTRLSVVL